MSRVKREIEDDADIAPDAEAPHGMPDATEPLPTTSGDAQLAQYQLSNVSDSSKVTTVKHDNTTLTEQDHSSKHAFALKTTVSLPQLPTDYCKYPMRDFSTTVLSSTKARVDI